MRLLLALLVLLVLLVLRMRRMLRMLPCCPCQPCPVSCALNRCCLCPCAQEISQKFDHWIDFCPAQGSRTIRTEEALLVGLSALRPLILPRRVPIDSVRMVEEQPTRRAD